MKRSSLVLLILCNLVWTFNPMMGKALLRSFSGIQVAWIRYCGGFLSYVLAVGATVAFDRRKKWSDYFLWPSNARTWVELFAVALGPFVFSPILQFVGLETAQALDNSILIATEPLVAVILARAVLGERMTRDHLVSMFVALVGFLLFSGLLGGLFGAGTGVSLSLGMLMLLFAQLGEGAYSVFGRKLVQTHAPTAVLGTALGIGIATLTAVVAAFGRFPSPAEATLMDLGAALWLGPIGSTVTYLIWAMIARTVTVPSMVITLFIQPVLGAAIGLILLGERLTTERLGGAGLILGAIAYLFLREVRRDPAI